MDQTNSNINITLEEAWIKSAIEHVTLRIWYFSARTKKEATVREVEPDYVGWDRRGANFGYWGHCRLRDKNRCVQEDSIIRWEYAGDVFNPNPKGRWRELLQLYKERQLDKTLWV